MPSAGNTQVDSERIDAVRRFNRFYTRQIGVLRKTYLDSPYSLGEMRVLYEIAHNEAATAKDIGRALDLDAGYLSRILRNFEKRGLITRKASEKDARQSYLSLTARGRQAFEPAERRSQRDVGGSLAKLEPADQSAIDLRDANDRGAPRRAGRSGTGQTATSSCARHVMATSAGSFPGTPSSMRRNTAGASRSRACARKSWPTSSTTMTPSWSVAGSPR